jgi:hypothetical protein
VIRRVFRGRSPYGLVRYLYGEGRRNEHTEPHLIASWDGDPAGLEPDYVEELGAHRVSRLARTLAAPVAGCDRAPERWVYHLVLRNDEADRRLSDEEWAQVCRAAMDRTGIAPGGDPAGCRWVAVRHADEHVHLIATLAREDGRPPRLWNDYRALAAVAHEYEDRFGLRSTAGRDDNTAARRPGVKETVTAERAGRRELPRDVLRQRVKAAAAGSGGFAEFSTTLARHGVTVWPRMSERNPGEMTGYAVSLDGWTNAAGEPVRFGGGKLAPDLSLPKLRARWDPAGGPAAPADGPTPAESTAPRRDGPLSGDEAERVWREAERIVAAAADRIGADAGSDPDGAADAAWAAGDTLAAAAAGVEGERGGPLTDAAEAFDRAGRESYRRIPARTDTGTALRAASRMISVLSPGTRQPAAQIAALTVALAALAAAVGDLRAAQHRLHQAEAARAGAERLRTVAPVPGPAPAAPTATRPRNAADIAALSFGRKPFRVTPADVPAHPRPTDDPAHLRPGPDQYRVRGPTI